MSLSPAPYITHCFNCKNPFDATEAAWCSCVVKERTLICSSCFRCFCKAPPSHKKAFWGSAPQELWDRKLKEHRAADTRRENPPPNQVARPLVLLVDDEREIEDIASRVILSLGLGLIVARNGEEGLALANEYRPNLVLSDAMMPKLDGREMARRIKQDPELRGMKVVIMTSLYTAPRYKHEAIKEFKVDDYLAKPIDMNQLRELLQRHIG